MAKPPLPPQQGPSMPPVDRPLAGLRLDAPQKPQAAKAARKRKAKPKAKAKTTTAFQGGDDFKDY